MGTPSKGGGVPAGGPLTPNKVFQYEPLPNHPTMMQGIHSRWANRAARTDPAPQPRGGSKTVGMAVHRRTPRSMTPYSQTILCIGFFFLHHRVWAYVCVRMYVMHVHHIFWRLNRGSGTVTAGRDSGPTAGEREKERGRVSTGIQSLLRVTDSVVSSPLLSQTPSHPFTAAHTHPRTRTEACSPPPRTSS
jgi:hypothetical protein